MPNTTAKTFYRSFIDQDLSGYALSGDFSSNANVTDRLKNTYAITSGKGTDGDSADFIADMQFDRVIDTIMLKSNLKTFTIYYWDGLAWQSKKVYSANTSEFLVIDFSEFTTSKIKITATHTITADEEKKIYLLEITKSIGELVPQDIDIDQDYSVEGMDNVYGGNIQVVKYPNYPKIRARLTFEHLKDSSYTTYAALKAQRRIDAYIVYLYFSDTVALLGEEAWYLVNDTASFLSSPTQSYVDNGIDGKLDLREC